VRPAHAGLVAALACVLPAGCTTWQTDQPVSPTSYETSRGRIERTVGKLRRLVAVAITQQAPKVCAGGDGTAALDYAGKWQAAERYLVEEKGYDIVHLDRIGGEDAPALDDEAFVRELVGWSAGSPAQAVPGPLTLDLLARLKASGAADGLLVFHDQSTCLMADRDNRLAMDLLTLGFNELITDPFMLAVHSVYHVAIVETASQRPVWRRKLDMYWQESADKFAYPRPKATMAVLFEELEPAIPRLLTR
jgi:hypothetical protein